MSIVELSNAEGLLDNQITISAILPGPTLSSDEWGEGRLSVEPDVQFSRGRFGVALPPPWGNGAGSGRAVQRRRRRRHIGDTGLSHD